MLSHDLVSIRVLSYLHKLLISSSACNIFYIIYINNCKTYQTYHLLFIKYKYQKYLSSIFLNFLKEKRNLIRKQHYIFFCTLSYLFKLFISFLPSKQSAARAANCRRRATFPPPSSTMGGGVILLCSAVPRHKRRRGGRKEGKGGKNRAASGDMAAPARGAAAACVWAGLPHRARARRDVRLARAPCPSRLRLSSPW